MTYLVVAVVLLSVVVIVLAWRMADFVQMVEGLSVSLQQEAIWRTSADDVRPTYAAYDGINARLNALAAALGYEWKRTEAKEGWEKRYVHPLDESSALAALRALDDEICAPPKPPRKRPAKPRRATH